MTAFAPHILKSASRELKRIDPPIAQRIVDRIRWLAENFEQITPEPLKGDLAGFFKLRRIIYEALRKERLIVVFNSGVTGGLAVNNRITLADKGIRYTGTTTGNNLTFDVTTPFEPANAVDAGNNN